MAPTKLALSTFAIDIIQHHQARIQDYLGMKFFCKGMILVAHSQNFSMIAVSQPSTPRPTSATDPSPTRNSYTTPAFHSSPYPGAMTSPATPRKRARSDSLFPAETGPFFSSTKPFDNLFAMDRTTL